MTNPFWSELVSRLDPYVPGEQPSHPRLVKLNTNENPFGPSPGVIDAIRAAAGDNLRLYPPPESDQLKVALADYHGILPSQVFVGNGSDEVLAHAFQAFFSGRDRALLFPDISYSFYPVYCGLYDIGYRQVPLAENFALKFSDYGSDNGGIIFPNPNAPTGMAVSLDDIEGLLRVNRETVVVVDEAYVDFGAESAVALVDKYPNLLVVQTLSKSRSLAGLRVGFAIGHQGLIEGLERVKNSFNSYPLDQLAIAGAVASLVDEEYFLSVRETIINNREALVAELAERGFETLPSAANFVFSRRPGSSGANLAAGLRERGVIVRHFNKPRIADYLRITVGTEEQHGLFLQALDEVLSGS